MFDKIVNPVTGSKVSIYGKIGQKVLKNYIIKIGGSSPIDSDSFKERVKAKYPELHTVPIDFDFLHWLDDTSENTCGDNCDNFVKALSDEGIIKIGGENLRQDPDSNYILMKPISIDWLNDLRESILEDIDDYGEREYGMSREDMEEYLEDDIKYILENARVVGEPFTNKDLLDNSPLVDSLVIEGYFMLPGDTFDFTNCDQERWNKLVKQYL